MRRSRRSSRLHDRGDPDDAAGSPTVPPVDAEHDRRDPSSRSSPAIERSSSRSSRDRQHLFSVHGSQYADVASAVTIAGSRMYGADRVGRLHPRERPTRPCAGASRREPRRLASLAGPAASPPDHAGDRARSLEQLAICRRRAATQRRRSGPSPRRGSRRWPLLLAQGGNGQRHVAERPRASRSDWMVCACRPCALELDERVG